MVIILDDVILNLEVIEHVDNVDLFLKSSSDLLKKNGIMKIDECVVSGGQIDCHY